MKFPSALLFCLALSAATLQAQNSPFLPPSSDAAPAQENAPLELRGILAMGGKTSFNLYNPATRTSAWVGLNETGYPFVVKSYDAQSEKVTVETQGRSLSLVLQKSKIASAPATPVPSAPPSNVPVAMPAPVLNPTAADEARRLEAVANEVRRRRALRQQAARMQAEAQANGQASQPGANTPAPAPAQP